MTYKVSIVKKQLRIMLQVALVLLGMTIGSSVYASLNGITPANTYICPTLPGNTAYSVLPDSHNPPYQGEAVDQSGVIAWSGITCDGVQVNNLQSSMVGIPVGNYYLVYGQAPSNKWDSAGGEVYYGLFTWNGTDVGAYSTDVSTRIISTVPTDKAVVATSTTFSISYTGYLNSIDLNSGSRVRLKVYNNVERASNLVGPIFANMTNGNSAFNKEYTYDIPSDGTFSAPTQTENIQSIGQYFMEFTIEKGTDAWYNLFDWFHTTIYSTTTEFTVSTTTQYDLLIHDTREELDNMGKAIATSTASYCNLASFQWYGCLNAVYMVLFVPSSADFKSYLTDLNDDVYAHAPLGYIKRFQDLLATSTTKAMPVIDYTFSTSSRSALAPILGGERIYFDPFQYATGTTITSITSDGANGLPEKNLWQIVEPFYNTVLALILMIMIIHDLTNIHAHGEEGSHKYGSDSEAYKEWQYNHRKV